jgi:putative endonuclease
MTVEKGGYIYILAGKTRRLYTGVTSELMIRVMQHRQKKYPDSFTARYNISRLVYYEAFGTIEEAIVREKQIKNMHRVAKVQLIVAMNPTWRDLSEDWGKPMAAFDGTKMRPPTTF